MQEKFRKFRKSSLPATLNNSFFFEDKTIVAVRRNSLKRDFCDNTMQAMLGIPFVRLYIHPFELNIDIHFPAGIACFPLLQEKFQFAFLQQALQFLFCQNINFFDLSLSSRTQNLPHAIQRGRHYCKFTKYQSCPQIPLKHPLFYFI